MEEAVHRLLGIGLPWGIFHPGICRHLVDTGRLVVDNGLMGIVPVQRQVGICHPDICLLDIGRGHWGIYRDRVQGRPGTGHQVDSGPAEMGSDHLHSSDRHLGSGQRLAGICHDHHHCYHLEIN